MSNRRKQQEYKRKTNEFGVPNGRVIDLWVCVDLRHSPSAHWDRLQLACAAD